MAAPTTCQSIHEIRDMVFSSRMTDENKHYWLSVLNEVIQELVDVNERSITSGAAIPERAAVIQKINMFIHIIRDAVTTYEAADDDRDTEPDTGDDLPPLVWNNNVPAEVEERVNAAQRRGE